MGAPTSASASASMREAAGWVMPHRLRRQLQLAVFGDLLNQAQLRRLQHQAGWRL